MKRQAVRVGFAGWSLLLLLGGGLALAQDIGSRLISPGPLSRAHATVEGIGSCTSCHSLGSGIPDQNCTSCHAPIEESLQKKRGLHGQLSEAQRCIDCHTEHKGLDFDTRNLQPTTFQHQRTGWELLGKHAPLECKDCHDPLKRTFLGLSTRCDSCHKDPHKGQFADRTCDACHSAQADSGWKAARQGFDHSKARFQLTGAHASVECSACHKAGQYRPLPFSSCDSCHKDPHKGQFADRTCDACHGAQADSGWKAARQGFDHSKARFQLTGAHASVECSACHKAGQYRPLPFSSCESCHKDPHKGQFRGRTCDSCHGTREWKAASQSLDHAKTRFPLRGAHQNVECARCHKNDQYKFASLECATCHEDQHKGQFQGQSCESCHGLDSFRINAFDHGRARFPLTGKHTQTACKDCHAAGRYKPLEFADCSSCHQDQHKGQFQGRPCSSCHGTEGWKTQARDIDHSKTRMPLVGEHAKVECAACHKAGKFKFQSLECKTCHEDPHQNQFPGRDCAACHTVQKPFKATTFEHALSKFPLLGRHTDVTCEKCHQAGHFQPIPHQACQDCHQNPHQGQFSGQDCAVCHAVEGFKPVRFDHQKDAAFPLLGKHRGLACEACHKGQQYKLGKTTCEACHANVHKDPLRERCETCHQPGSWTQTLFPHDLPTFKLEGQHLTLPCEECHKGGVQEATLRPLSPDCVSCHHDLHAGQMGNQCSDCHRPVAWSLVRFEHPDLGDRLAGIHATLQCKDCHANNQFHAQTTECLGCHLPQFQKARDPDHAQLGLYDCGSCHRQVAWSPATFRHDQFALTGAHAAVACAACHKDGYQGASPECRSCHQPDYDSTTNPNHPAAHFATTCQDCHSTNAWKPAALNHAQFFQLTGAHQGLDCAKCHTNGQYQGTPRECVGCHQPDYAGTKDPDHAKGGFATTCQDCHSTNAWTPSTFNHAQVFALTGAHQGLDCAKCHTNGQYQGTPRECVGCHQPDYAGTQDPDHAKGGFATTCQDCHSTNAWKPASVNHNQFYPLTGAHLGLDCAKCHVNGQYQGTPRECVGCHQPDFNGAKDPDHMKGGFPATCQDCHSTNAWKPATFNHNDFFALTGAHLGLDCAKCHANGQYQGTPRECVGCHQPDYNGANDPAHAANGFPTTCQDCHSTNAWTPSTFDHSNFFPIPHRGVDNCKDCHLTQDLHQFSCIDCHEHNKNDTDSHHREVSNYQYNSQACFNCHPDGRER